MVFSDGNPVLVYEQDKYTLAARNLKLMWYNPFIFKLVLKKHAYELVYFKKNVLSDPRNGIFLKTYYA